jgi:hypothetical protein
MSMVHRARVRTVLLALMAEAFASIPGAPGDEGLTARIRRVEAAFRRGDATELRASFAAAGKVRVELRDLTEGQSWYASGQLQVLFARIFEDYSTRELAFAAEDVSEPTPGTAFARARWVRRARRGGPEITETLVLTFRREKDEWRILEIRSSR